MKQMLMLDAGDLERLKRGETIELSEGTLLVYEGAASKNGGTPKAARCGHCKRLQPGPHSRKCPHRWKTKVARHA